MRFVNVLALIMILLLLFSGTQLTPEGQKIFFGTMFTMGLGLAIYSQWFKRFNKKIVTLQPLIKSNPDEYISEINRILEGKMPKSMRAILKLNIATAFVEKKDFEGAYSILSETNPKNFRKMNRTIYYLNFIHSLVHVGKDEEAINLIKAESFSFANLPRGGNILHLRTFAYIFEMIYKGEWREANELMTKTGEELKEKPMGVDFDILKERLREHNREEFGKKD